MKKKKQRDLKIRKKRKVEKIFQRFKMFLGFTQKMYDGESISFNKFKNKFAYDAGMFGWDEKMQAKLVKYCLTGIAKDTYDVLSSSDKDEIDAIFDDSIK